MLSGIACARFEPMGTEAQTELKPFRTRENMVLETELARFELEIWSLMRISNEAQNMLSGIACARFELMRTEAQTELKPLRTRENMVLESERARFELEVWCLKRISNEAQTVSHNGEYAFGDRMCAI